MKILFVTHASFEKPGSIESWARKRGHQTQEVRTYNYEKLPNAADFDFLVLMGGPQSSLELDKAPYLRDEIELIKQAVNEGKRILGICLGAQLIGEALGALPERSPNREIGTYPIELLDAAKDDPVFSHFPQRFDMMHWHSDMPGIPEGAVLLAESKGCPRQAFRYGDRIYGFQCHFELTTELVDGMIQHCLSDVATPGPYIRSVKELLETDYSQINKKMDMVLDYLENLPELTETAQSKFVL